MVEWFVKAGDDCRIESVTQVRSSVTPLKLTAREMSETLETHRYGVKKLQIVTVHFVPHRLDNINKRNEFSSNIACFSKRFSLKLNNQNISHKY